MLAHVETCISGSLGVALTSTSGQDTTSLHSHPPPHSRNVTGLPHLSPTAPVNYTLLSQKLLEPGFKLLITTELPKKTVELDTKGRLHF